MKKKKEKKPETLDDVCKVKSCKRGKTKKKDKTSKVKKLIKLSKKIDNKNKPKPSATWRNNTNKNRKKR